MFIHFLHDPAGTGIGTSPVSTCGKLLRGLKLSTCNKFFYFYLFKGDLRRSLAYSSLWTEVMLTQKHLQSPWLSSNCMMHALVFLKAQKAACITIKFPQLHSVTSDLQQHILFPSLWLLDEPSVQESSTAINKVSLCDVLCFWTRQPGFSDCTSGTVKLALTRQLLSFLFPDFGTDSIYRTCVCLQVHYLMPVLHLLHNCSPLCSIISSVSVTDESWWWILG